MNTAISTKLAALAIALLVNGPVIGGIAYLFSVGTRGCRPSPWWPAKRPLSERSARLACYLARTRGLRAES